MANEPAYWVWSPGYYYDVVTNIPAQTHGMAGSISVLMNAWSSTTLAPALLNVDASGNLLIAGTINASSTVKSTAAAPTYVEGTNNPVSSDLSGNARVVVSNFPAPGLTDTQLRASAVPVSGSFYQATQPVSGTFFQATQPVSLATNTPDVTDRVGRLLGHVTVDSAPTTAVTGTFWQGTQPVSLATNTPDVTDRSARLLGHVTVDSAPTTAVTGTFWQATQPVSGTFFQATQPVSGTITANIGTSGSLALDATLTGGTLKAIARGAAKGTTASADITSNPVDANTQAQHVTLAGTQATVPVTGTFWQATQPVSGTFWQATQPVSGTVTANAGTGTFAVSGTFWQATQPVSIATNTPDVTDRAARLLGVVDKGKVWDGTNIATVKAGVVAVTADNPLVVTVHPSSAPTTTQPVSGTFWQATQPVSGTFFQATQPVSIATMPSTPVTGTFWQATQPVSLATAPALVASSAIIGKVGIDQTTPGTTNAVSVTNTSLAVTGTFWQTTQPVSLATNTPDVIDRAARLLGVLSAGSNVVGGVTQSGTWNVGTVTAVTAITNALPAGTNSIGTVQQAAITKATQGTTGVTTQDLKDAGRAIFNAATAIAGVTAVTTEALLSFNVSRDGATTSALTTIPVTSGKRLRVTGLIVGIRSTSAAVLSARVSLRLNPSGTVTTTSPIIATVPLSSGAAVIEGGNQIMLPFPDGIEFSGTHQIGLSQVASAATGVVYATILGFEY